MNLQKGIIEFDKNAIVMGLSSKIWNALEVNPNMIMGESIHSFSNITSSTWNSVVSGTLISHQLNIQFNNERFMVHGMLNPIMDENKITKRVRYLIYNILKK